MKINKVHCMFEQSGTFKKELLSLGIPAEDYDILDEFGQTDHKVDLFHEIDEAYEGRESIFDNIGDMDLVLAFFPCTRFESVIPLAFRGEQKQQENWPDEKKLEYSMKLHDELHMLYTLICKLFAISIRGGWRMIVENPYSEIHYLRQYFPIKPKLIDRDRTRNGDYFKKPTQYWFVNCEPEQNVIMEPIEHIKTYNIEKIKLMDVDARAQVKRSLINPQYARRFIINHVMTVDGGVYMEA